MAMGQNPNCTPSEHPNPTTKIGSKMGGAPTPPKKGSQNGFDRQPVDFLWVVATWLIDRVSSARSVIVMAALLQWYSELKAKKGRRVDMRNCASL